MEKVNNDIIRDVYAMIHLRAVPVAPFTPSSNPTTNDRME
jgi:hypothetical protein